LRDYYIAKAGVRQAKNFLPCAPTNPAFKSKNIFLRVFVIYDTMFLFDGHGNDRLLPITMATQIVATVGIQKGLGCRTTSKILNLNSDAHCGIIDLSIGETLLKTG